MLQKGIPETGHPPAALLRLSGKWLSWELSHQRTRPDDCSFPSVTLRPHRAAPLSKPDMRLSPLQSIGRSKLQDNLREGPYRCHQILTLTFVVMVHGYISKKGGTREGKISLICGI